LKKLDDWDLLSPERKQYFINEINNQSGDIYFNAILKQAERDIEAIKNGREPDQPDQRQRLLEQTKQSLQTQFNLSLEEFNLVLEPITELKLLKQVQKLLDEVKGTSTTNLDSLYETLRSYKLAPPGSLKNQAYQAVNSYQQQVDQLITSLQKQKDLRTSSLQKLVSAQSETELNEIYQALQSDPELSQASHQTIIDNHKNRVVNALKISSSETSD
jgi:hypothetical protein